MTLLASTISDAWRRIGFLVDIASGYVKIAIENGNL